MKNKENENQEPAKNKDQECRGTGGFSILNHNYLPFLAYDLTPNLPDEPIPEEKNTDKEKPASYLDDPEALKAIEQFKAYATKIKPPME